MIFSFREELATEVLEGIERRACEALGFAAHQRLSVVHNDTDHPHLHIAINRVHPSTHKVHSPSFSKLILDRLCVELEQHYGLAPDRHRANVCEAAPQSIVPPTAIEARQPAWNRKPHDMERVAGVESLVGFIQRRCAEGLRAARSWGEVHALAEAHGLELKLRGNGLVFVTAQGVAAKASAVARDLSKPALERRLGLFVASTQLTRTESAAAQYRRAPLALPGAGALYEVYLEERAACVARRAASMKLTRPRVVSGAFLPAAFPSRQRDHHETGIAARSSMRPSQIR